MQTLFTEEQRHYLVDTMQVPDPELLPAIANPSAPPAPKCKRAKSAVSRRPAHVSASTPASTRAFPVPLIVIFIAIALLLVLISAVKAQDSTNSAAYSETAADPELSILSDFVSNTDATVAVDTSAPILEPAESLATNQQLPLAVVASPPPAISDTPAAIADSPFSPAPPHPRSEPLPYDFSELAVASTPLPNSPPRSPDWLQAPTLIAGCFLIALVVALFLSRICVRLWCRHPAAGLGTAPAPQASQVRHPSIQPPKLLPAVIPAPEDAGIAATLPPVLPRNPHIASPRPAWDVAAATHPGNVRPANEDVAVACRICGIPILNVHDGCGGTPNGGLAARAASDEALQSIADDLARFPAYRKADLMAVVERAIYAAAVRLSQEARSVGMPVSAPGMRTTLIIVAGALDAYVFGYLGDGGGLVLRADGTSDRFLVPQKVDPRIPNLLAASLGPWIEGNPMVGAIERHPGELLLVGTDGAFDFAGPDFPRTVARLAIEHRGDLQRTADTVVTEMAQAKDRFGWIVSDNISLGLMAGAPLSPAILDERPAPSESQSSNHPTCNAIP